MTRSDYRESASLNNSPVEETPRDLSEVINYSTYDLKSTIRLIVLSGECRRIDIAKGASKASIYANAGEIYHVRTDTNHGDEAFFEILSWKNAVHSDVRQTQLPDVNMRIPTSVLLDLLKSGV